MREEGRTPRRKDDPWLLIIHRFVREFEKCSTRASYERLAAKYPGIYHAYHYFSSLDQKNKWTIEAYLCADASMVHIAERMGCHIETVFAYTKMFFDILGKQRHRMYMMNQVLGKSIHAGLTDRDYDLLWKLFGMLKGPLFLDRFINHEGSPSQMTSYDQGSAVTDDLFKTTTENHALVAMRTIECKYNQEVIFSTYQKLKEMEKISGGAESRSLIVTNINKMISTFGFAVAADDAKDDPVTHLENGVEMRTSEIINQALGVESVNPSRALNLESFPEPESKAAAKPS